MSNTNDFVIDNNTGQAVRLDIEDAFQQLATNNAGDNKPTTPYNHQWYANETSGKLTFKDATSGNLDANYFNLANLTGGLYVDQASTINGTMTFNNDVIFSGTHSSGSFDITFDADNTSGRGALAFKDETKIILGTGNDFAMAHQINLNLLSALTDTRTILTTRTNNAAQECFLLQTQDSSGSDSAYAAILNAGQHLFFNGAKKLETTANGITVTGSLTATAQPACLLIDPVDTDITSTNESTPIKFNTEQTNVGCTVNTDKDRITVPISGTYLISVCLSGIKTNATSDTDRILKILKNGNDAVNKDAFPRDPFGTSRNNESFSHIITMPLVLSANDYLELCFEGVDNALATVKFGYFSVTKLN